MRFVSAEQVARLAGVSRSAVSRTFTPGTSVAPATREKVLHAASQLGYQVNEMARAILANHSRLVGIVATRPEVGFRAHLAAALTRALIQRGSIPILVNTGQTEAEMLAAQKTLIGHRAEATIILSGSPPSDFVELARRNGQPLVLIGRSDPGADQVRVTNTKSAAEAAAIFADRGCTHLAVAGSKSGTASITERENGFLEAARLRGVSAVIARGTDSDYEGGVEAARELFAGSHHPDAVFCVNDQIAFGLMDFVRSEKRIAIPEQLSVIGFDDVPEAAWLSYRLTSFRQDPMELALRAVDLIGRRLENPEQPPLCESVDASLVLRDSLKR